jgi:oligopeptide transport system ATP-binding protein
MTEPLLAIEGLAKTFHVAKSASGNTRLKALDGISLTVGRGETLGLVGESGCGKTTLARTLMMLETPDEGTVSYRGTNPFELRGKELLNWRRRVQMVFKDPFASLNARMSAGDIVPGPWATHRSLYPTSKERQERVSELLQMVGLRPPQTPGSPPRNSPAASARALAFPGHWR